TATATRGLLVGLFRRGVAAAGGLGGLDELVAAELIAAQAPVGAAGVAVEAHHDEDQAGLLVLGRAVHLDAALAVAAELVEVLLLDDAQLVAFDRRLERGELGLARGLDARLPLGAHAGGLGDELLAYLRVR